MRDLIRQKIVDALASTPQPFTRRDVRVPAVPGKAIAVIGMRRSGKTTFLGQLRADRLAAGTPREALLYFSFEDERLAGLAAADLQIIVEEYFRLHPEWRDAPKGRKRATLLLDEIQVVPGWETFVRRLLDSEHLDVFLSGSSARLLSREVATAMRGRAMEALVHPFSFREFLRHRETEPTRAVDRLPKAQRSALEKQLLSYLTDGGFPEAQGLEARDRIELLRSYVDTTLFRDVVERHAVSHPVALRWMVRQLLANPAGLFSVQKFYDGLKSQGVPVAKDTLHAYLAHLEDAFLVRTLPVATSSERRRQVNPRKAYPIDPGLSALFERSGRPNLGHALENVVLLELERRGCETAYVRTSEGLEVDFLTRTPQGEETLIQVCADLRDPETLARETRALLAAKKEHRRAALEILTLAPEAATAPIPDSITVRPAAAWLLQQD
jgi:hypothetical protein